MIKPKLVIVDSMAIIHRAYHAYPALTSSDGHLVNAVYGFGVMFFQIIKLLNPDFLIFASDHSEQTFRTEKYKDYKANRKSTDIGLVNQFQIVYDFIYSTGLPFLTVKNYEADDIIGSIAANPDYKNKYDIYIITGDKDLLQMLSSNVRVVLPGKTFSDMRIYDENKFYERFGFSHQYYIDFKALLGDTSDNIKGAKGIGEKTATDFIKKYNTIGGIYQNIDNLKDRYKKILLEYKNRVFENLELVEIYKDLKLAINENQADLHSLNLKNFTTFLKQYNFNSLLSQLQKINLGSTNTGLFDVDVNDLEEIKFKEVSNYSQIKGEMYFTKVDSDRYIICDEYHHYILVNEIPVSGITYNLKLYYKKILEKYPDADFSKYTHNDLLILAYCHDPILGVENKIVEPLAGMYKKIFHKMPHEVYKIVSSNISAEILYDLQIIIQCYKKIITDISEQQKNLYKTVDLPLVSVLAQMEMIGMNVDVEYLKKLENVFGTKTVEVKKNIFESIGHEFNPNSTKELAHILYEELSLPKNKKNKTGYSTDERTLAKLIGLHPIIGLILEYRELAKLQSTYILGIQKLIKNGKIYTELRQTTVATGRLSSINPNLQNIPIRSEAGEQIRKAFVALPGKALLSLDYSQIDLRMMAHICKDPELIKAFKTGKDIHTTTSSLMFSKLEEEVTKEERRIAKMINFGIIYGISDFGLSDRLGNISVKQSKEFIEKYFEKYKNVKQYFENIKAQIAEVGYVETIFGRRRYFNLDAGGYMVKQALYREAINMPTQGSSADLMKISMIKIQKVINDNYTNSVKMLLQIHDELLFEIDKDDKLITDFIGTAKNIMEHAVSLEVPLVVNAKLGDNWGDMKEWVI